MKELSVRASSTSAAFQVILTDDQHHWSSDVPEAVGGGGTAPTPHQLLLSSLGACTSITVAMYAQRKEMPLTSIEVNLSILHERLGNDAQLQISRDIRLCGSLSDEQRARLLDIANACPIHKVLSGEITIASTLIE